MLTMLTTISFATMASREAVGDDFIQIRTSTSPPVVEPGKPLNISVSVKSLSDHASMDVVLRYSLNGAGQSHPVVTGQKTIKLDSSGNSEPVTIDDVMPSQEGVFEFRCVLEADQQNVWTRFRRRDQPIAESQQHLISLGDTAKAIESSSMDWTTVSVIRPSESSWSVDQWLPKRATRLMPGAIGKSGELTNGKSADELTSMIDPQNVFQASLPIAKPHHPHRITIRYPALMAGQLRVDAASGENRGGLPTSFVMTRDDRAIVAEGISNAPNSEITATHWATHSFIYYPSGDDRIWLTNLSDDQKVGFESIRIEAGPERLSFASTEVARRRDVPLRISNQNWVESMTLDLDHSGLLDQFSGSTSALYKTWTAAERLSNHALANGTNGIAIPLSEPEQLDIPIRVFRRRGLRVWIAVDDMSDESNSRVKEVVRRHQNDGVIAGLIVRVGALNALETVEHSENLFSELQRSIPDDLHLLVESEETATTRDGTVNVKQFVRPSHERLSSRTDFQHALETASIATSGTNIAAVVGQTDAFGDPVVLCHQLVMDACRIIDQLDPSVLLIEIPLTTSSLNPKLANTLHAYASMPDHSRQIESADQSHSFVRLRSMESDGKTYLALFNTAPWESVVDFMSSDGSHWETVTRSGAAQTATNTPVKDGSSPGTMITLQPISGGRFRIPLSAGSVTLLRSSDANKGVESWMASIGGSSEANDNVKKRITSIVERIGVLADPQPYPGLINGGFEQFGGIGLVGWMHAQHPRDCVVIDKNECVEGRQAVMLTTDATVSARTWLVSETILPPRTGRLAVSMACRGEVKSSDSTHKLRVSIEATDGGTPIRHSQEFAVPCNGKWGARGIVLEADMINPRTTESLRVTIDSLSPGRVWIDDIQIHDYFPTAKERGEFQTQTFLAVQGLQRGNLTQSARLLNNPWSNFLLLTPTAMAETVPATTPTPDQVPGVADRMKSWLPRPLRF